MSLKIGVLKCIFGLEVCHLDIFWGGLYFYPPWASGWQLVWSGEKNYHVDLVEVYYYDPSPVT